MAGATNAARHMVGAGYIMQMIASETSNQIICSRTVGCTCVLRVEPVLPVDSKEQKLSYFVFNGRKRKRSSLIS